MQNEFQAAYELSSIEQRNHIVRIPEGLFAVVSETPAYCPFTDATLRKPARHIERLCGTYRIAAFYAAKLNSEIEDCGDLRYIVLPKQAAPSVTPPKANGDDSIPF